MKTPLFAFLFVLLFILSLCKSEETYDVIVLGSGGGGISAASYLAQRKKKVLLIEKGWNPGGSLQTFSRVSSLPGKNYSFSPGMHYVAENAGDLITKITGKKTNMESLGDYHDLVVVGDKSYEIGSMPQFKKMLESNFPTETEAISKFIQEMLFPISFKRKILDFITSLTDNEDLLTIFSYVTGDFGMLSKDVPIVLYSGVFVYYSQGGYFPTGGTKEIVNGALSFVEKNGGKVITGCPAKKILLDENEAVKGVVACNDDQTFLTKTVVSDMGLRNTFNADVLDATVLEKHGYLKDVETLKSSYSCVLINFGFNNTSENLGFLKANIWWYESGKFYDQSDYFNQKYAFEKYGISTVFISSLSARDSAYPDGLSEVAVVIPVSYEWFAQWENSTIGKRPKEYYALKQKFVDEMLKILYKQYPKAEGYLDVVVSSSPLTMRDYLSHQEGSTYGVVFDFNKMNWATTTTKIKGLYISGQDLKAPGIQAVLGNGIVAAQTILGEE